MIPPLALSRQKTDGDGEVSKQAASILKLELGCNRTSRDYKPTTVVLTIEQRETRIKKLATYAENKLSGSPKDAMLEFIEKMQAETCKMVANKASADHVEETTEHQATKVKLMVQQEGTKTTHRVDKQSARTRKCVKSTMSEAV